MASKPRFPARSKARSDGIPERRDSRGSGGSAIRVRGFRGFRNGGTGRVGPATPNRPLKGTRGKRRALGRAPPPAPLSCFVRPVNKRNTAWPESRDHGFHDDPEARESRRGSRAPQVRLQAGFSERRNRAAPLSVGSLTGYSRGRGVGGIPPNRHPWPRPLMLSFVEILSPH